MKALINQELLKYQSFIKKIKINKSKLETQLNKVDPKIKFNKTVYAKSLLVFLEHDTTEIEETAK